MTPKLTTKEIDEICLWLSDPKKFDLTPAKCELLKRARQALSKLGGEAQIFWARFTKSFEPGKAETKPGAYEVVEVYVNDDSALKVRRIGLGLRRVPRLGGSYIADVGKRRRRRRLFHTRFTSKEWTDAPPAPILLSTGATRRPLADRSKRTC